MGVDKSRLVLDEISLLEHVILRVGSSTAPLVVVGKVNTELKQKYPKIEFLQDQEEGRGPLEGIRIGMQSLVNRVDYALVVACDNPLISAEVIDLLFNRAQRSAGAVGIIDGTIQPIPAIYQTACLPLVESMLKQKQRSVKQLAMGLSTTRVTEKELRSADANLSSFLNINFPDDYQRLIEIYGQSRKLL